MEQDKKNWSGIAGLAAVGTAATASAIFVPGGWLTGTVVFCSVGAVGLVAKFIATLAIQGSMAGGNSRGEATLELLGILVGVEPKSATSSRESNLALLNAARTGDGAGVEQALGAGASPNVLGSSLEPVLVVAVESGDVRAVRALAAVANARSREMAILVAQQANRLDLSQEIVRSSKFKLGLGPRLAGPR